MRQSHRLVWNTLVVWAARVLRVFPEVFLLPFVLHRLGPEGFGIYSLAWAVLPLLARAQEGMGAALIKYAAAYLSRGETGAVNRVLSTACLLSGGLGIVGCIGLGLIGVLSPDLAGGVSPRNLDGARFAFLVLAVMVLVAFPLLPYSGILQALQRYDIFSLVDTSSVYLKLCLLVVWFIMVGPSVEALMVISASTYVLSNIVLALIAYRLVPGLQNQPRLANRESARTLLGFGLVVFLCSLCMALNQSGVRWLVGFLVSVEFVATVVVMLVPAGLLMEVVQAMSLSVMPAASRYEALADRDTLRDLMVRGTRYMTVVIITGMIGVVILTRPILEVWMGAEYSNLAPYVILLCCGAGVLMSSSASFHMLRGMGKLRESLAASAIGPVVVTLGTLLLSSAMGLPAPWMVVVGVVAGQVVQAVLQTAFCLAHLGVPPRRLLWHAYAQPLVLGVPAAALPAAGLALFGTFGLGPRAVVAILAAVLFLVAFERVFFTPAERDLKARLLSAAMQRIRGLAAPAGGGGSAP